MSHVQKMRTKISDNGTSFCKVYTYWNALNLNALNVSVPHGPPFTV